MSDSNPSHPESLSTQLSLGRKKDSSEATASFGSFSEFGESNIGSTVYGGQERSFFFGTTAANNELLRELPSRPCNAPKPTSCCQSPFPGYTLSTRASTSDPPSSPKPKLLLVSNLETTIESESHLPGKKSTFVPTPQSDSPSKKLTLGGKIVRPFDQRNTLSLGSLFSGSSSQPSDQRNTLSPGSLFSGSSSQPSYQRNTLSLGSLFSGSSSQPSYQRNTLSLGSLFSGSSSQPSMFLSSPTQSSQLGVKPKETTTYEEEVVEVGTENVGDEDGVLASISSKSAFRGISHEELRWQNYQDHYRGNNFGTSSASSSSSTTSTSFNNIPPLASGQTNSQPELFLQPIELNMININVPSFQFGQQNFTGHSFLLCLNNGPGFGFGQTIPCIIAFPQSASAFPQQNTSPGV